MHDPRGLSNHALLVSVLLLLQHIPPVVCQCSGSSLTVASTYDIQYVTSPGYSNGGGTYPSSLACSWILDGGSASSAILLYVTHYDVTCTGDHIDIYDGNTTSYTALVTGVCGTSQSGVYTSSQRYVRVDFTSDVSNQGTGFQLAFMKASDLSGSGCSGEQALIATSTPQYFTSPNFPGEYTVNSNCRWVVTSSADTVSLEIVFSDIESSTNCAFDSLQIYSGTYVCEKTRIVSICSHHPDGVTATFISNGTSLLVTFTADASLSYHGFVIRYSEIIAAVDSTTSSSSLIVSYAASSEDNFYLGLYIGLGSGAGGALLILGIICLIRYLCHAHTRTSPSIKHVSPLTMPSVPPSRDNSICGSSSSSGDSTSRQKSFFCSTPNSPGGTLVLEIQSRKSSTNGFLK